jgi:hypothetical protein
MPNGIKSPGKATFEGYMSAMQAATFNNHPSPSWEDLDNITRQAWEVAAFFCIRYWKNNPALQPIAEADWERLTHVH